MKGLLLKDWYMIKRYNRAYLLIAAVFVALSLFGSDNLFFMFYPCLFCGIIPVSLLGYDERSGWMQYSAAMPYTKAQLVSGKYAISLLVLLAVLLVTGIAQAVKMTLGGGFEPGAFAKLMALMLPVSVIAPSVSLPFIFRLGVEKGRAAYYIMIGFVCGAGYLASGALKGRFAAQAESGAALAVLAAAAVGIYLFSWRLSIRLYQKREIQ